MKVLIVNTSDRKGGAAVAANRLMHALNNHGVKVRMLVRDKQTTDISVVRLAVWPILSRWRFLWERLVIFMHLGFKRQHLFEIDIANTGVDITQTAEFRDADVIHLHWVNQGMLSLSDIRKIIKSGKPVVWTMHDLWPATAVCHYARECRHYTTHCQQCPLLPGNSSKDLSSSVWKQKQQMLAAGNVYFVACSRWLEGEARKSALLKGHTVTSIPNPIDDRLFRPTDQAEARQALGLPEQGRIILFVSQRVTDRRKGMDYLIEAIRLLVTQQPDMKADTRIAIMGSHAEEIAEQLALPTILLGYQNDERAIASVYNAADVFVTPSLEDNLPNTIMEAMACGVPCVGFRVGGIPEMIDHQKTGYVAAYRDSSDLAQGISWVLNVADRQELSHQCLRKVSQSWSQASVSLRYTELYQEAIAQKHFKL